MSLIAVWETLHSVTPLIPAWFSMNNFKLYSQDNANAVFFLSDAMGDSRYSRLTSFIAVVTGRVYTRHKRVSSERAASPAWCKLLV